MQLKKGWSLILTILLFSGAWGQEPAETVENLADRDVYTGKAEIYASQEVRLKPGFRAYKGCDVWVHIKEGASRVPIVHPPETEEVIGPSSPGNYNWIHTVSLREATSDPLSVNSKKRVETYDYYDGLGRFSQQVAVQASPDKYDLVRAVSYDDFGRKERDYLPYQSSGQNGDYNQSPEVACETAYTTGFEGRAGEAVPRPFTQTAYEPSPLNRVSKTYGPGNNWAEKPSERNYLTNSQAVAHWDETGVGYSFGAHELYVTQYTDEDGQVSREFKDKLGQVVRKESDILDDQGQAKTIRTAYVYDDFGLLRTVIPPKAGSPADAGLCYFYTYDERRRMVSKDLPGGGVVYLVYDDRDRLVMSQDGNLREAGNKWLATIYDPLNRPVITGLVSGGDYLAVKASFEGFAGNATFDGTSTTYAYHTGNALPAGLSLEESAIRTVTYYDNYNFLGFSGYSPGDYGYSAPHLAGTPGSPSLLTKTRVTGSLSRVLDPGPEIADTKLLTVSYYDDLGRLIRSISDTHLGGKEKAYTRYNFAGQPEEQVLVHQLAGHPDVQMTTTYSYDHQGRLLHEKVQMDDYSPVIVAANKYNAIGELVTKYLHGGENGNNFNQKIDYRYTIRGWLAGINQPGELDGNLFALSLAYEDPQGTELAGSPRYNGNISQMRWHTALAPGETETEEPQKGYGFTYDRLNRLRDASYADGAGYNLNAGRYGSSYLYDDNGNLEFLSRQRAGSSIDALSYHYPQGSNQLESVTDDATDIPSDGYLASVDHYQYDRNGNMTLDPSKNTLIDYNELNLPSRVDFDMDKSINYTYDALGNKLQKRVVNTGAAESTVDYSGAFVYENKRLRSIFTPEGRLGVFEEDSGSGETNVLYKFEYHLKDHLGNVRVVFGGHSNGEPEYIQRTDYYPFGLVMAQKNYTSFDELSADWAPFENKYLYNGKEWQNDEVGGVKLDWYDYGARMYDPELGRWHVPDPLAEWSFNRTPYRYGFNNPIRYIDPDGMFESRREARRYRRENNEKGRIRRNDDGSYSIDNKKAGTSIWNDPEFGISIGALAVGDRPAKPWRIFMQKGGYSGTGNGGQSIGRGYRAKHNYGTLDHSYFSPQFAIFYFLNWAFRNRDYSQSANSEGQKAETSDKAINESMDNNTDKSGKGKSDYDFYDGIDSIDIIFYQDFEIKTPHGSSSGSRIVSKRIAVKDTSKYKDRLSTFRVNKK